MYSFILSMCDVYTCMYMIRVISMYKLFFCMFDQYDLHALCAFMICVVYMI